MAEVEGSSPSSSIDNRLQRGAAAASTGFCPRARARSAQPGIRRPRRACCATCRLQPWRPSGAPASRRHGARLRRSARRPERATGPGVMGRRWRGRRTCGDCRGWRGRAALRGGRGRPDRRLRARPGNEHPLKCAADAKAIAPNKCRRGPPPLPQQSGLGGLCLARRALAVCGTPLASVRQARTHARQAKCALQKAAQSGSCWFHTDDG